MPWWWGAAAAARHGTGVGGAKCQQPWIGWGCVVPTLSWNIKTLFLQIHAHHVQYLPPPGHMARIESSLWSRRASKRFTLI